MATGQVRPLFPHLRVAATGGFLPVALLFAALLSAACGRPELVLTELADARALAADLTVQLNKAVAATDRAVLADTDEASASAAGEAREARRLVEQDAGKLASTLQKLGYKNEHQLLDQFNARFKDYEGLDDTLLGLAVENTNLKAQRLSFGPEREASDAFRAALDAAAHATPGVQATRADVIAARGGAALLHIQVLEARHIAEADEATMSALEAQMTKDEAAARTAVNELRGLTPASARPSLDAAAAALDRFAATRAEIVQLSRRNTNVRSAALALGRKRTLAAGCEEILEQLSDALSKHQFTGTR